MCDGIQCWKWTWQIYLFDDAHTGPIDNMTNKLGIPLEMIFGDNFVAIEHGASRWGGYFLQRV
ncbi:hypothetical protein BGW36DRAFT_379642 [Talaromyces proteolyticus]|uniref:Uncharacterized protein n=1 Tax=Talaromyces proteolyticus TaxID=1131652 RepID=A0AAD4PWI6_9EURO|nr:uncharacterized protein BGW36DRAFT_379642 [Talaromyces proteolyticus]KAH8697905.1 hypothetical protein BGW36DRAFT_379642 [Talaromyces proteolyticus]